jgi:FAD/FMN-containing dehydrogenase/Fe-S oxidoreductase
MRVVNVMDANAAAGLLHELSDGTDAEVRSDRLSRAIYATDASIYQIVPDGVVIPRSVEAVQDAVRACGRHGVPITARGAGTGLAGGAVNRGIQLDCSKYLRRILHVDADARLAVVEPGVVLDELNERVKPLGLHFAPDVATSSRATIGGMIANNSCGARSVMFGRTVDHLLALQVVLSDGSVCNWGEQDRAVLLSRNDRFDSDLGSRCETTLTQVCETLADEIAARFPKVLRSNGGYALDRLKHDRGRINTETIICGSEGTLGIVVGAVLKLTPLPKCRGLVVAHFADLLDALAATPIILEHKPAAVELLDRLLIDAARKNSALADRIGIVQGQPGGVLIIELFDDDSEELGRRLRAVADELRSRSMGYAWPIISDSAGQSAVWDVRKAGLGLLMSRPGERQPYDFVDDTAVDPRRLRDYIARFMQVLKEEDAEECSYYAHASVGCLHVKPILNLRDRADVKKMHRVADRICSLAIEFNGTMTGEHGDGLVRSVWLEKLYGPRIVGAFKEIKAAFDPQNILNPGKIVNPLAMTDNLRWLPVDEHSAISKAGATTLDFSAHGGMLGLADMCSGVGQCRQKLVGVMCPSYLATLDEKHTTRARANALRMALDRPGLLSGIDDPALEEAMDLCISCKACKAECPTGVDMARLKAEWQHQVYRRRRVPLRSRLIARSAELCDRASHWPGLTNRLARSGLVRALLDRTIGVDRRVPLPRFASQTFRAWFAEHRSPGRARKVVYFVDTWTNYFTPQVGIAAVGVLEKLGFEVIVPPHVCCGRPAISKGMLDKAKRLAERNAAILAEYAEAGLPIVGTEPSCILTFIDEFPQLVRTPAARKIAQSAMLLDTFIARQIEADPSIAVARTGSRGLLLHGHCHQKALVGTADSMRILRAFCGQNIAEINGGCCGMAGSFGHESEHYEVAKAIGEDRVFPAVRRRGQADIAVTGFSCRHQIEHHTGSGPRHVIEHIADSLPCMEHQP